MWRMYGYHGRVGEQLETFAYACKAFTAIRHDLIIKLALVPIMWMHGRIKRLTDPRKQPDHVKHFVASVPGEVCSPAVLLHETYAPGQGSAPL